MMMASTDTMTSSPVTSRSVYLTPDERYQIWTVKCAERPELLFSSCGENDEKDDEAKPLVDGCDIPSWRRRHSWSNEIEGVLNVGSGCTLLRRESQIPVICIDKNTRWRALQHKLMHTSTSKTNIERLALSQLSATNTPFFERENRPILLEGCMDTWPALQTCRLDKLVERFGDMEWRFSDTHAETMPLETFSKYAQYSLEGQTDDAPLAVYDSQLEHDARRIILANEYVVPDCFDHRRDLWELVPDDERPPYRWILIGGARSGTGLHVDPVGTHAWVALVQGKKRWVLFPPDTPRGCIRMEEPQVPSAIWFRDYYDDAMKYVEGAVEVVQNEGEVVYVPAGWPHLVLNLETSVAITHNYATEHPSIHRFLKAVREEEPDLADSLLESLEERRPELLDELRSSTAR